MSNLALEAFRRTASLPGIAFLDGAASFRRAPLSHLSWDPVRELRIGGDGSAVVDGRPGPGGLDAVDRFLADESAHGRTVIGVLGYELCRPYVARGGRVREKRLPLAALRSYARNATFDGTAGCWLGEEPRLRSGRPGTFRLSAPRAETDFCQYESRFRRLREWIAAGDVYQANLSITFEANVEGDAWALYDSLSKTSPAPYGAYVDFGDFQILSNSPELFLSRRGARVITRPIKGTRPRGSSETDDRRLAAELRADTKERAEHVMIVDLERNDLGRIAETGSVAVEELEQVERYATVHHLESTIAARVPPATPLSDFLRALFPGGSITGAPKIRAMEILDELEPTPRGFYTGSILHHPPSGDFTMSIAIRTATVADGRIRYAAGGAVVADSRADREWAECLLKARAFLQAAGAEAAA